jgi:hypothetical protein
VLIAEQLILRVLKMTVPVCYFAQSARPLWHRIKVIARVRVRVRVSVSVKVRVRVSVKVRVKGRVKGRVKVRLGLV